MDDPANARGRVRGERARGRGAVRGGGVPVFGVGEPVDPFGGDDERRVARLFVIDDGQPSLLPELAPDSVG